MKGQKSIVVVGAGIGGLTAGLCLERAGFEVQVVERFDEVREVGAGILLAPNASHVHYNRLGLGDELDAASAPMDHFLMGKQQGDPLFEDVVERDDFAGPCRMIHRAELQRVLYEALGPEKVRLSSPVARFQRRDDGVAAVTEDGDLISGSVLIGADGLHSVIRAQVVSDTGDPLRYHGYTCWRGITAAFEHPDFRFGTLMELQGRAARIGMGYVDEERLYWWATADAPEGQEDGPERVHQDLHDLFAGFPDFFHAALEATAVEKILRNDIYDRKPLRRWGSGPVTLLGDAAHPMAPNLGQGACSAIEDADMLALCLKDADDPVEGLRRYEAARIPRTARLQKLSKRFGDAGQMKNGLAVKFRELSVGLVTPLIFKRQQRWLWDYDAQVMLEA